MEKAVQTLVEFKGVRVQIDTPLGFDEVLSRLHEQTGKVTAPSINKLAAETHSTEEFAAEVTKRYVGPSDFMIFSEIDHTQWMKHYGIDRRVLRIILGNPLIAITMLSEDLSAGLFAPVEMLLVDAGSGTTVIYERPSTLMVVRENPPLKSAAVDLDHKLEALIATITGLNPA